MILNNVLVINNKIERTDFHKEKQNVLDAKTTEL